MKTYNCGGQQNQEKNSKLKTAAKNFFKSSKELGVALGEETKNIANKTKYQAMEKTATAIEAFYNFMNKNPKIAGVVGVGSIAAGIKLFGIAGNISTSASDFINVNHAVTLEPIEQLALSAMSVPGYVASMGVSAVGVAAVGGGIYGVGKLCKHAEDNRWATKAKAAIRNGAQKYPDLHKFLVAANHKIYKGVQILKREIGGR